MWKTRKPNTKNENGEVIQKFGNICWYTNLHNKKRNLPLDLYKKYNEKEFPKYDNYDAIEVSKVCDIPMDYDGVMGVPITFLDKYNPEQFEIVGSLNNSNFDTKVEDGYVISRNTPTMIGGVEKSWNGPVIGKQPLYKRIVVRHKDQLGVKLLKLLNEVHDIVSAGGSIDDLRYNQISVL